ncbi:MAG: methionyl-tRNA formyltransferase [Candidatus Vogelbacteria bacterium CG22_combo_CG10-13_8_21_14_all_37_9]|uniref:methionyl-tRNA formyltransferase n=1 Tax=Candidatus Vogelbacteria bacterium CG22_combo_CG10-13_8_21_14_all_37_9 TaxID=1975046 RepID=A0A2H0BL85_9BACT|nr:MAG: hypothetical protein BK005_02360 [bacterium CG10_37_50]PIP58364.1 MAG: methionyl-tRNA formyltransferase [Candidatus Vogelbacteria bacterium CG22_combo_CG10-13_8_21_14_all_37_9]
MKWAFFGTDEFSVLVLVELAKTGLKPDLIISTPDQVQGRHLTLSPPPIKIWAQKNKIPLLQPESLKKDFIFSSGSWDLFLVASYGKIIPESILEIPTHQVLNIHPSLLPLYRGPSPLQSALLNGETETGVTIMLVDPEMDHGPILAQEKIDLTEGTNYLVLEKHLAILGAQLFAKIIPTWLTGQIKAGVQNHALATYTRKFLKADGEINLADSGLTNYHKYQALHPRPGVFTYLNHKKQPLRIIIKQAHLEADQFIIDRVIPEGRKEITWTEFQNGLK